MSLGKKKITNKGYCTERLAGMIVTVNISIDGRIGCSCNSLVSKLLVISQCS